MKNYGMTMEGPLVIEKVASLPTWASTDEGRLVYNETDKIAYIGTSTQWQAVGSTGGYGTLDSSFDNNDPLEGGNVYLVDTSSASKTGILPASPSAGQSCTIVDVKGSFKIHPFYINGNGHNVNGAGSLTVDVANSIVTLIYTGATDGWKADIGGTLAAIGGGSASTGGVGDVVHVTSTHTATDNQFIFADTTTGAFTITLPSTGLANGSAVTVYDQKGLFNEDAVTVSGAGNDIMGNSTLIINTENARVDFIWDTDTTEWKTDYSNATSIRPKVSDISTNTDAKENDFLFCDTWGGSFTVTLPTSADLQNKAVVTVFDQHGTFGSNALTVIPSDGTIDGDSILVCDIDGLRADFVWDAENLQWKTDFGGSVLASTAIPTEHYDNWLVKNVNFNIDVAKKYIVDTTSGTITATLPSTANNGEGMLFADGGDFSVNNLTIARNGNTIEGIAEDMVVSTVNQSFELVFYNNNWILA